VAILEAQAACLPVVSTLHAGIPEIVEDAVSGFLVPEGDEPALADRLAELSRSPSLRATMGIAGRAIVMGRHDIRLLNRELIGIYEEVEGAGQPVSALNASSR
jgi:colanic acid/amylovoran biosynthesis glycosyltransferase